MAKAKITLPNGTHVDIEGTTEEVRELLEFYSGQPASDSSQKVQRKPSKKKKPKKSDKPDSPGSTPAVDYAEIVNLVKDCDEAEKIEKQILDRASQVNRALLPLYIVHEYLDNKHGITSGEVSKVTTDLGIPISQPNASRTLSGTASRYVIGDKVKRKVSLLGTNYPGAALNT